MVVLDIPLLSIVTTAGPAGRRGRGRRPGGCGGGRGWSHQRGFAEEDARARVAAQIDRQERRRLADLVVDNSGGPGALEAEIDRAWDVAAGRASEPEPRGVDRHRARRYASQPGHGPPVPRWCPTSPRPATSPRPSRSCRGLRRGDRFQTLLGITGSGKSATIAWTIEQVQRPTLVIAPNKSLAAQLANEFREFFPDNRVEYFVSYYDYYQPEAYIPSSDTYIEKDSSINDEIDRLRHSATSALLTRRDTIVVASVWCIYGLGSPEEYPDQLLLLQRGDEHDQRSILRRLVDMQYERNDLNLVRGKFRVRGDTIEVHPAYEENAVRIELFGDEVERITIVDPLTGEKLAELDELVVFPATHYVAGDERMKRGHRRHRGRAAGAAGLLRGRGQAARGPAPAHADAVRPRDDAGGRLLQRHRELQPPHRRRQPGEPPHTLLDFFPNDFLLVIDESHQSVPQLHGQYEGDRSRKETLIEHGFRLPSAADNRPLRFEEFYERVDQCVFLSATPAAFELEQSTQVVEQIVRPTGLVDPEIVVKPTKGQIDDLIDQINDRAERGDRVLVTTLTKKMSEDLTDYLLELGVRVRYLHCEVDTIQRIEILRDLRLGEFDVLVGINLLREGLDLPEVSLVAILDADKEGFLRSETSLIQTIGRAARNVDGQVIMYADRMTDSMQRAISETNRRRACSRPTTPSTASTPRRSARPSPTSWHTRPRTDGSASRAGPADPPRATRPAATWPSCRTTSWPA